MARVFLSFLGTNDYLPCTYYYDMKEMLNVRFVQEASLSIWCRNWTSEDRVLIFTTSEAETKNWYDDGHIGRDGEPLRRKGLKKCIEELNLNARTEQIKIPSGQSESEIWEIFDVVLKQIRQEDEVIFDITHALRSIPMLAIVVLNYAKVTHKVKLQGIYYGAFEVLGSISEALKIPIENRRVPIFNLTPFDRLMEWAVAVDRFLVSGDARLVSKIALDTLKPDLKESKGKDEVANSLKSVANSLNVFSRNLSTCRGSKLENAISRLKQDLNDCKNHPQLQALNPLLNLVKEEMSVFKNDFVSDGIKAAKWCFEHNLIQQGYTILQEFLISHFIICINKDYMDKNLREIASQAAKIHLMQYPSHTWHGAAQKNPELTNEFIAFFKTQDKLLFKLFDKLSQLRNDLNHAGFRHNPLSAEPFETELEKLILNVEKLISKE